MVRNYDLRLRTALHLGDESTPASYDVTVRGQWELRVLEESPAGVQIHAVLNMPDIQIGHSSDANPDELIAAYREELGEPIGFRWNRDGSISHIRTRTGGEGMARQSILAALGMIAFSNTSDDAHHWTAPGNDTTGRYEAQYERVDGEQLRKEKLRYLTILAPHQGQASLTIPDSAVDFRWIPGRGLATIDGTEAIHLATDSSVSALSRTELKLELKGIHHDPHHVDRYAAQLAGLASKTLYAASHPENESSARHRARMRSMTPSEVLEGLRKLSTEDETQRYRRGQVFLAATSMLHEDPEFRANAIELIRNKDELQSTLIDALGESGHPESLKGLLDLVDDGTLQGGSKLDAIRAVSYNGSPTDADMTRLVERFEDPEVGEQARYSTGTIIHRLRGQDPAKARKHGQVLIDDLNAAHSDQAKIDALRALGNAGLTAAWPYIQPILSESRALLREAAVDACRRIPGAGVDAALLAAARNDPDVRVRYTAVVALGARAPSQDSRNYFYHAATSESVLRIRSHIVRVLSRAEWRDAAALDVLREVAQNDPSRDLRDVAKRSINTVG